MRGVYWETLERIEDLKRTPTYKMTDWQKHESQNFSIAHGKKMIEMIKTDLSIQFSTIEIFYKKLHCEKGLKQVLAGNSELLQPVWHEYG